MLRVRLFHWKATEAATTLATLQKCGCAVEYKEQFVPALMRELRRSPPDAFVIDLSRLPSQGLEIAIALRNSPATRQCPIVFCGGAEDKVRKVREHLPDAAYCELCGLATCLRDAVAAPRGELLAPRPMMERYAGRSAAQKLGIRPASVVRLIEAPRDYDRILGELPEGVIFEEDQRAQAAVVLCFINHADTLRSTMSEARRCASRAKLWILWRKKASESYDGVTGDAVRETGISLGLVDYKICSVDKTWSGMLFALKR